MLPDRRSVIVGCMTENSYDVIVSGARCAGSPTASLPRVIRCTTAAGEKRAS